MISITHRRGAGRRPIAAVTRAAGDGDARALRLTVGQQEYLTVHGFGPDAPQADFGDPAVRSHFVQLLRDCGALAPATTTTTPAPAHGRRHHRRAS
jgi:hypothetical protein